MNKITIPAETINKTFFGFNGIMFKSDEYAGRINFLEKDCKIIKNKRVCHKKFSEITKKRGDGHSVDTPISFVNYHTHPIKCYSDTDSIWGWPSGEDMLEAIRFADGGNKYHLVFTAEGIYIIKVLTTDVENKNLILDIFKDTHEFRCIGYDPFNFKTFIKNKYNINVSGKKMPDIWINLAKKVKNHNGKNIYSVYLFKISSPRDIYGKLAISDRKIIEIYNEISELKCDNNGLFFMPRDLVIDLKD